MEGRTDEHVPINIEWSVAKVRKPLLSATRMTEKGHHVHLEEGNSFSGLKGGHAKIPLHDRNGSPAFMMWRKKKNHDPSSGTIAGFGRPESNP